MIKIDSSFSSIILENLNNQRQTMKFCDFTLKAKKDNGIFHVHKSILAASSPFFDAKFNNPDFCDNQSDTIELDVTSNVLDKIINFMYTTKTEIYKDDAREMLDTSLFLRLDSLVHSCAAILIDTIDKKNWFDLLDTYETYHLTEKLTNKCIEFILNHNDIINSEEFGKISADTIKRLVKFDRFICTEESICFAVIKWIIHDIEQREKYLRSFFDEISFSKISNEFCMINIFNNDLLMNNATFLQNIVEIFKKNTQYLIDKNYKNKPLLFTDTSFDNNFQIINIFNSTNTQSIFNPPSFDYGMTVPGATNNIFKTGFSFDTASSRRDTMKNVKVRRN